MEMERNSNVASMAVRARHRFLSRYEWPSLWETQEVQETLSMMWQGEVEDSDPDSQAHTSLDPEYCHDRDKPRCTMQQYVALVAEEVAQNLEGLARARLEKRPRQYQRQEKQKHQNIQNNTASR